MTFVVAVGRSWCMTRALSTPPVIPSGSFAGSQQPVLDGFPVPGRTDNHFIVDPAKWDFYAMDAYRLAGEDSLAVMHANEVLASSVAPDGTIRAPMRMAEAKLTLGVAAARDGNLEEAISLGREATESGRKSIPSLLMVAGELDAVLEQRFPDEPETEEFCELLRSLRSGCRIRRSNSL
ncbi:hypothetical protein [Nonomuraea sp. NPDC049158]